MMWLETLIELNFLNSSFLIYPLEIRQTVPCRAVRGNSISVNSALAPSYKGPFGVDTSHECGTQSDISKGI